MNGGFHIASLRPRRVAVDRPRELRRLTYAASTLDDEDLVELREAAQFLSACTLDAARTRKEDPRVA